MTRHLVIMVKEPRPGRVKTRLGRSIGYVRSAWWFRHQTRKLINELARDPRWHTVLAVSPDVEGLESRVWPYEIPKWPQGRGDLGARMKTAFRIGCSTGPTVIIGADIPGIRRSDVAGAFKVLGNHDAVFGRAPDGGYWLIGLKGRATPLPASLFDGVRWSTEHALQDTLKSMGSAKVGYLRTLQDVDTVEDLKKI